MNKDVTSSRRRNSAALTTIFVVAAAVLLAIPALAVNATGAFELDGNAITNHSGTGAPDDWDRVFNGTTNGATAVEFASQPANNGTTFTGGGSKDPIDVSSWAWNQGSGGLPGKDILLNGFAARYSVAANASTCPSPTPTCSVIFFGMDRFDNAGDAQNGFWFFQNKVSLGSTKSGGGQTFNGVHKNGDILVVSDFSIGGTVATVTVFKWDTACTAAGKPSSDCADSNLRQLASSNTANCKTSTSTAAFCGIVNQVDGSTGSDVSPWPFLDKKGNTTYDQGEFYEGGLNLSAFPGLAGECFASTLAESRSSTSTSAVLKSFVLGNFGACQSGTVTTPEDSSGTNISNGSVSIGPGSVQVKDKAVVTINGASTFAGSVTFHLCGPADLVSQSTCATGGTAIGLAHPISPPSPVTVTSDLATVTSVGSYCWRADYSGDSANGVPASSDSTSTECFSVTPVTPSLGTTAGSGPVVLGSAVSDTATLSGTATKPGSPVINPTTAGGKAGGTITFTLYGPNSCTLLAIGTGTNPQNVSVNGDATYGPVSFTPVAAGTYSWVASYGGDSPNTNGTSHNTACNDTGEDVVVEVLPTTTVTTPVDVTGGAITSVSLNTSVYDHAVVTGQALGGSPSGSVSFFICNPTQVSVSAGSEVCGSSAGSPVGSAVPTTAGPGANQSQATSSPAVVANQVGVWCFRATFTPSTPGYTGSSDNSHDECFTVTDTTSISTAQNWLPNDSATITSGGSTLDGTVTFTLYDNGTCTGNNPIYTEGPITVSGGTSQTVHTNNGTVKVSASATVSWKVVYTSNNGFVTGSSTSCTEVTGLSISN